jgi:NAD-dependent dihydropyrimidine dehydrogenase PreA subunit
LRAAGPGGWGPRAEGGSKRLDTQCGILARIGGSQPHRELLRGESKLMAYVIAEPCIGTKDTACVDACPVDCIHPKKDEPAHAEEEMLYIDPVECIDCGACVPVCPVSAIFALDDLPEKWKAFTERNAAYYGRTPA